MQEFGNLMGAEWVMRRKLSSERSAFFCSYNQYFSFENVILYILLLAFKILQKRCGIRTPYTEIIFVL